MCNAFVAPGVGNGMPAKITTRSAVLPNAQCWMTVTTDSTISEMLETSREWMQWPPQSSRCRSAVFKFDVNTRMKTPGRSLAARNAVQLNVV
jgi:hypothetical protein